jgi:hypothetical protein
MSSKTVLRWRERERERVDEAEDERESATFKCDLLTGSGRQ